MKVDRTVPKVDEPKTSLEFSGSPTPAEIFGSRVFEEPLVSIGGEPTAEENAALATALVAYSKRSASDDFASLTGFLHAHPKSPWRASLLANLGLEYYNTGHYSLAIKAWEKAWERSKGWSGLIQQWLCWEYRLPFRQAVSTSSRSTPLRA